jgi:hypothetical protein
MSVTLGQVEQAVFSCFALDTCSFDDVNEWSETNRSRGHCAVTTLTLNDMFGGQLLCAEVHVGSELVGYHWWNRLGGLEVDLTLDQFASHELVGVPWVVERPVGHHLYTDQYNVFRERVTEALAGLLHQPASQSELVDFTNRD